MTKKSPSFFSPARGLLLTTGLLTVLGLLFVFDASVAESYSIFGHPYHFLQQQALWVAIGTGAFFAGYITSTKFWLKISPVMYLITLLMLIALFIPSLSLKLNGARRWLSFGPVRLQPIEFLKFSIITFFASWLSKHQRLVTFLIYTLIPSVLILLQPDLGSLLIMLSISLGMYFISGGKMWGIVSLVLAGVAVIFLAVITSSYRMQRLQTFLHPTADPLGAGFHTRQITLALGRGQFFGQGIGNSRQKYSYIPEASSDSIFAIVAEEVGFLGSVVLIGLFASFIHFGSRIAAQANQKSGENLVAWGILIWIASQILLNLAAMVAIVPLTGIPLPFFSYGGSSLVMILFATGVLTKIGSSKSK